MIGRIRFIILVALVLIMCGLFLVEAPPETASNSMPMPGRVHPVVTFSPIMQ